jgi:hypothetical protein
MLRPATYRRIDQTTDTSKPGPGNQRLLGFIAEEMPRELVSADGKAVDLYALTTSLTAAVQALKVQVDRQSQTIDDLKAEVERLRNQRPTQR